MGSKGDVAEEERGLLLPILVVAQPMWLRGCEINGLKRRDCPIDSTSLPPSIVVGVCRRVSGDEAGKGAGAGPGIVAVHERAEKDNVGVAAEEEVPERERNREKKKNIRKENKVGSDCHKAMFASPCVIKRRHHIHRRRDRPCCPPKVERREVKGEEREAIYDTR